MYRRRLAHRHHGGAVAAVDVRGGGPGTRRLIRQIRRRLTDSGARSHARTGLHSLAPPPLTDHQKAEDPCEHTSPGSSIFKIKLTGIRCTDVPTAANCIGCELATVRDSSSRGAALPFVIRVVGLRTR